MGDFPVLLQGLSNVLIPVPGGLWENVRELRVLFQHRLHNRRINPVEHRDELDGLPLGHVSGVRDIQHFEHSALVLAADLVVAGPSRGPLPSSTVLRELDRWELGTHVLCHEVTIRRRSRPDVRRIIWWERERWFARRG